MTEQLHCIPMNGCCCLASPACFSLLLHFRELAWLGLVWVSLEKPVAIALNLPFMSLLYCKCTASTVTHQLASFGGFNHLDTCLDGVCTSFVYKIWPVLYVYVYSIPKWNRYRLSFESIPKRVSKDLLGHVWVLSTFVLCLPTLFCLLLLPKITTYTHVRLDEHTVLRGSCLRFLCPLQCPSFSSFVLQNRTSQHSTLQNSFNRPKILWQLQKLHQFGTVLVFLDKNSSSKSTS